MTGLPVEGDEYFSFEDVNMEFLDESPTYTVCSWQGEPSYDTALVDERRNADATWYYPHPSPAASRHLPAGSGSGGGAGDPVGRSGR
jgi:uncharacterized protein (DUF427 family)